jgi:two-component system phosphate regulon sensor histidine kinase PhoR
MPRRPFLVRLLVPFIALWVAVSAASLGLTTWVARGAVYVEQVQTLDAALTAVRLGATEPELRALARTNGCRLTLIGGDGVVRFDTDADPAQMPNHNDRPEVVDARRAGVGTAARSSATLRQSAVYLAARADPADPQGEVVRVCYLHSRWASPQAPLWAVTIAGAGVTAVMIGVLAAILQRQWVGPTRQVVAAARRLASGQWDARVDPSGAEDVRALGAQLNTLAAQAELQLAELKRQRRDLRSLVDALPDPILVTDVIGRVELVNVPAADLLELSPARVAGHQAVAVITDETLLRALDSAGDVAASWETRPVYGEVRLARHGYRRTYQSFAARTHTGGSMLVLRDVTAMADAVQMKTDFVANASHELRTPIAAIKIALETLRDATLDDPPQAERCVNIIDGHVRRLEDLLRDLLDLSRLENPEARPALLETKPWELFAAVRAAFGPTAKQKGVDLRFGDGPATPASFRSDEHLLNLVLKNLVENSLKFTPAGGSVTVSLRTTTGDRSPAVHVSVADTGIGIPPEHRDRVFERFYQVDPARSGTAGRGTGLGLAIVKHAVAALGGTVRLESVVGRGTTVTCVLPQEVTVPEPVG